MHRRVWFLAALAAGVLLLAGSAAAMTAGSSSSHLRVLAAAPYAKAAASIPRTPAARAVKKDMVFGLEQTVTGFNLNDADENAFYAAIVAGTPIIRGNYLIDNSRLVQEFGMQYRPYRERVLQIINEVRREAGLPLVADR